MSQLMSHQDTNLAGNVHGGVIMKLIDTASGVAAVRHARSNVVTASIDRLDFHHPVFYRRSFNPAGHPEPCREDLDGGGGPGGD